MTPSILSRVPIFGKFVDERFLEHRRRSTSLAGIFGVCVAGAIFYYHLFVHHTVDWGLVSVITAMAVVKISAMIWYRMHD